MLVTDVEDEMNGDHPLSSYISVGHQYLKDVTNIHKSLQTSTNRQQLKVINITVTSNNFCMFAQADHVMKNKP